LDNKSALTCSGTKISKEKISRRFSEVNETVFSSKMEGKPSSEANTTKSAKTCSAHRIGQSL
jgi:hypothetical protein